MHYKYTIKTILKLLKSRSNSFSREFKVIKFSRSMLGDRKMRWYEQKLSNQSQRARTALRRLLNAPELPICLSYIHRDLPQLTGETIPCLNGRTGTVRRVASSQARAYSTPSRAIEGSACTGACSAQSRRTPGWCIPTRRHGTL